MNGEEFEEEVRNVARALWGAEPGEGGSRLVGGRERDCIFEQEFVTHYIECTKSRKKSKVKKDVDKMVEYRRKNKNRTVRLWEITLEEPTEHQRKYCRENDVDIMSLNQFKRHIIDSKEYIELRKNYPFGSAIDPEKQSTDISDVKYQPVAIRGEDKSRKSIEDVAEVVSEKNIVLLLGDYGMGKSINIKEAFDYLAGEYFRSDSSSSPVPVVLNLREHWGQSEPEEVLRRHARSVGMSEPDQLVRAFNAGRITLFLDGFDEISDRPWSRLNTEELRTLRMRSVKIVKKFISKGRGKVGILVAGRPHFFDTKRGMIDAFGIRDDYLVYELDEFTEEEAKSYLRDAGFDGELPDWLPRRPLLLASLVGRDLLEAVISENKDTDPAIAWNDLLDEVCYREAQIHEVLDARSIRRILERLASKTRSGGDGLGPVTEDHIAEAFKEETGASPDNSAKPLLQRLPGLSVRNPEDGTRSFIDDQMIDVLRAGDVYRFVQDPWSDPEAGSWSHSLQPLGVRFVAKRAERRLDSDVSSITEVALKQAVERWEAPTLALDTLAVLLETAPGETVDLEGLTIRSGSCGVFDLSDATTPKNLRIDGCTIDRLVLPIYPIENIEIRESIIHKLIGASKEKELPEYIEKCEILNYDNLVTNSDIMNSSRYSDPIKVMLTVLKKIYTQKGSGRRESALMRGSMSEEKRKLVPEVVNVLRKHGIIFETREGSEKIWHPKSSQWTRVESILNKRTRSGDEVIIEIESIQ